MHEDDWIDKVLSFHKSRSIVSNVYKFLMKKNERTNDILLLTEN